MQRNLANHGITYRVARSRDTKAAIVERFIRTIKERTWYFTRKNTRRYVDVLQKIIEVYNHTKDSATKMIPASVTLYNAAKARENLQHRYGNHVIRYAKYGVGLGSRQSCKERFR